MLQRVNDDGRYRCRGPLPFSPFEPFELLHSLFRRPQQAAGVARALTIPSFCGACPVDMQMQLAVSDGGDEGKRHLAGLGFDGR